MNPFLSLMLLASLGSGLAYAQPLGSHPGYVSSVAGERNQRVVELVIVSIPEENMEAPMRDRIFDERLTREFREKYEERFGRTDAERNIVSPSRYDEYEYSSGVSVTIEEDQRNRREFGEYMVRRLTEHHVDQFARSSPTMRPVYEVKEQISNVDMEVRQGYKVNARYSFSGNFLDVRMENPLKVDTKLTFQMNPAGFGPSEVQETLLTVGYPVQRDIYLATYYAASAGTISLVGTKTLRPGLSFSVQGTKDIPSSSDGSITTTPVAGRDDTGDKQNLVLLGLTWTH